MTENRSVNPRPFLPAGLRAGLRTGVLVILFLGLFSVSASAESQEYTPERYRAIPELSVGDVDGTLALTRVESIIVVGSRVLVSQPSERVIRVLDAESGELLAEWGGTGEGPGEMRQLAAMSVVGSSVIVVDRQLDRVTTFTLDGGLVGSERFHRHEPSPPFTTVGFIFPASHGTLVAMESVTVSQSEAVPDLFPARLVDLIGNVIDTLPARATKDGSVVLPREGVGARVFSRPLHRADRFAMSVDGSRFVQARDREGTGLSLAIYHIEDRRTEMVDLGIPPVPVPPDEVARLEEAVVDALGARGAPTGHSRAEVVRALALPSWIPAVDEMFVTASGETWLREPAFRTATHVWRVVGPDGSITATVEVPRGIVLRDRDGDHLWGFRVDPAFGVTSVERLRLEAVSDGEE
ncbi:MAG: hypothetical protein WD960_01225 [Gemmatimonadota bacterium]